MGKKNPKKTQRTIPAIKSTMSCSKIHTDQKKRSTKRVSCFEILIANPEYKTPTHTHLRHMKRSSIQEIEHIPIRAGKSLPGFHLFFFPPTQPRVFSLPKVSPNFSEIRSQLRLRATFFISTPEFLRRCSWFTTIITDEKDRSRGPGRTRLPDNQGLGFAWLICFLSNSKPVEAPNGLGKSPISCAHKAPLLQQPFSCVATTKQERRTTTDQVVGVERT